MKAFFIAIWQLMKKISVRTWLEIIIGIILLITTLVFIKKYNRASDDLAIAQQNNCAYQAELEGAQKDIVEFEFSMKQMRYFNDSISQKLIEAVETLKLKDNKIKELQYMLSHFERNDTITLHDTIFREKDFILDTTIGDQWMSTSLHMQYPSIIVVKPLVKSEKEVVIYSNKETVNPPSKCFLVRLFQKKHIVVHVNISEKSPYLKNEINRFVHIVD